jgi:hypothetical protein
MHSRCDISSRRACIAVSLAAVTKSACVEKAYTERQFDGDTTNSYIPPNPQ